MSADSNFHTTQTTSPIWHGRIKAAVAVMVIALIIRGLLLAWAYTVAAKDFEAFQQRHIRISRIEHFWRIWSRWDGQAYLEIAAEGYQGERLPKDRRLFNSRFPPLYPLTIRTIGSIFPGHSYQQGITVSILLLLAASYLCFLFTERALQNTSAGLWAVFFLNLHPGSYFAHSVYSESMFLFFSFTYLLLLQRQAAPILQSLPLAALILTRQAGIAFLPAHAFFTLRRLWQMRSTPGWRFSPIAKALFAIALPLLSYGLFISFIKTLSLPGYSSTSGTPLKLTIPFSETYQTLVKLFLPASWSNDFFLYTLGASHSLFLISVIIVVLGAFVVPLEYTLLGIGYLGMLSLIDWNIGSVRYSFGLCTLAPTLVALTEKLQLKTPYRFFLALLSGFFLLHFTDVYITKWKLM